jgi:glycosyltransferase involved in cell wall biosynthesis
MRIGFISQLFPYLPSRDGFRIHAANLIRSLSNRHTIDLIALQNEVDEPYLEWPDQYCASVTTIPERRHATFKRLANFVSMYGLGKPLHFRKQLGRELMNGTASGKWDVLHVEGSFIAGLIPSDLPVPQVLALHDSWVLRCEEMLKCSLPPRERAYYRLMKRCEPRYERLVYPRFERCTTVSSLDEAAIQHTAPQVRLKVIPNGTDTDYFHPIAVPKEAQTLVFHGNLGYWPNVRSAQELADVELPLVKRSVPGAVLHLVGANPAPEIVALSIRPDIRLSANLRDLRPALCSGTVYVCAVRCGSGMKNKILEAMAMQLPVVSCPEAVAGIACVPGEHLLIAETSEEIATATVKLLNDPELALRMGAAGRKFVVEQCSWRTHSLLYEATYDEIIREKAPS